MAAATHLQRLDWFAPAIALQVAPGPWLLSAANTLRALHITQQTGVLVVPAAGVLQRLTALQDLSLCGHDIGELMFETGARLPSQALTSLSLSTTDGYDPTALPPSVRATGGW